jgi:hypothetical protein
MVQRPIRATPGDLHGNLFGRIPSPGTRPRDVFPRRRPRAACASCIFWNAIVQGTHHLGCSALVPFGCIELSASSVPRMRRRTFTKLYTSLTALNIRAAIRVRPQFNPECRVSKAHRNILCCRFAERKVILAEVSRWVFKFNSAFDYYCISRRARVIAVIQFCITIHHTSISGFLGHRIQSSPENVRIERDALSEDISIGGTG